MTTQTQGYRSSVWHTLLLQALFIPAAMIVALPAHAQFEKLPADECEGLGRLVEFVTDSPIPEPVEKEYERVAQIGFIPDDSPSPIRIRPADKPYQVAVKTTDDDGPAAAIDTTAFKPGARVWFKGRMKVNIFYLEDSVVFPDENIGDIPDHWPSEDESRRDRLPVRFSTPGIDFEKVAAWVNRMPVVSENDKSENAGPGRHLVMTLKVKNPTRDDVKITLDHVFLAQRANTEGKHVPLDRISLADDTGRETGKHTATIKEKSDLEMSIRGLNVFDVPPPDEAQPWLYAIVFLTLDIDGQECQIILRQTGEIETVW